MTACPNAAELENPERFEVFGKPADGPASCAQALPDPAVIGCDYAQKLQTYCSQSGCHGSGSAGGLSLETDDEFFIARILDQPAVHRTPRCSGNLVCDPAAKTCDRCDRCPENALLVDSANPDASWLLQKLAPFVPGQTANVNVGCGEAMPSFNTGGSVRAFSADDKSCLERLFRYIATQTPNPERFPCDLAADAGTDAASDAPAQD